MKQTPDTYTRVSRATYILISVCMVFLPWFKYTVDRTSVTRSFYNLFRESIDTGVFGNLNNTLFYAFGALLFVAALVGIILSLLGKSSGSLLYFGTALLSFALLVIPTAKGFAAEGESAFSVLRICPWLFLIFALLAFVSAPKQYSDLEFLRLPKKDRFAHSTARNVVEFPNRLWAGILNVGRSILKGIRFLGSEIKDIFETFANGDWKTRMSYLVMGFGCLARGQILRGLLFLLFEGVFIFYMIVSGGHWLHMLFSPGEVPEKYLKDAPNLSGLLGQKIPETVMDPVLDVPVKVPGDDSFKILLYGVLTLFFIVAFLYTWRVNIKQNKIAEQILRTGKPLRSGKEDLRSMVDDNFHVTLLALPVTGIMMFTVMPIVFMILVAFTNYSGKFDGVNNNLFGWMGMSNFNQLLSWTGSGGVDYSATFGEILTWTLIWAFFATFTNYFLGMFVAMMINKKGIQFKKVWRTILVLTIAIPQFISLLYVSKMFSINGIVNGLLVDLGVIDPKNAIDFLGKLDNNGLLPRIMVIVINIWIGIPYLMLIATGILMNIPADLYESSRIDGASGWKQFSKITLPYMLFITGPYLLTSFTGNMNNFNVIFLLTGGAPTNAAASGVDGSVGFTDLLITWLFKITTGAESKYYMASVIGILVFIVVAVISLVVYNLLPSVKNEEDFQ